MIAGPHGACSQAHHQWCRSGRRVARRGRCAKRVDGRVWGHRQTQSCRTLAGPSGEGDRSPWTSRRRWVLIPSTLEVQVYEEPVGGGDGVLGGALANPGTNVSCDFDGPSHGLSALQPTPIGAGIHLLVRVVEPVVNGGHGISPCRWMVVGGCAGGCQPGDARTSGSVSELLTRAGHNVSVVS